MSYNVSVHWSHSPVTTDKSCVAKLLFMQSSLGQAQLFSLFKPPVLQNVLPWQPTSFFIQVSSYHAITVIRLSSRPMPALY